MLPSGKTHENPLALGSGQKSLPGAPKEPEEPLDFSGGSAALGCSNRSMALTAREGRVHSRAVILPDPWPWTARLERGWRSG